jgi:hypothetical protein
MTNARRMEDLRQYCIGTVQEAYTAGVRFAVNLRYYRTANQVDERETTHLLIDLYETLVRNDQQRREVARAWLSKHCPIDLKQYMERIEPHSELWFSIVERVEPQLGLLARANIHQEAAERHVKEEAQSRAGEVHPRVACSERGEMELVAPEILWFRSIGRAAQECRELAHLTDIVALGVFAELADGHVFDHPPPQRADGRTITGLIAHGSSPVEGKTP